MTAIAYRDGVMAADTAAWIGGHVIVPVASPKIVRLWNGVYGACGGDIDVQVAMEWFAKGGERPVLDREGGFECIFADYEGDVWFYNWRLIAAKRIERFVAIGESQVFMLGAMAAGASAQQAVQLAIDCTDGAAGMMQFMVVKQKPD